MATKKKFINEGNLYEWLCSTGYLLPTNEIELFRFELLHPVGKYQVNELAIDPIVIIKGRRQRLQLSFSYTLTNSAEYNELKMAARKHEALPDEIIKQIKRNQQKNQDGSIDNS